MQNSSLQVCWVNMTKIHDFVAKQNNKNFGEQNLWTEHAKARHQVRHKLNLEASHLVFDETKLQAKRAKQSVSN